MSKQPLQRWYRFGVYNHIIVLMDCYTGEPLAQIEHSLSDIDAGEFSPLEDEFKNKLLATAGGSFQHFGFDFEDSRSIQDAIVRAMAWCEGIVGPPILWVSHWELMFKAAQFWKYKALWKHGKIQGLLPRGRK